MQIAYHFGVHCTDEDKLIRCLLKNRGTLAAQGIVVPGPGRYRPVLRQTLDTLHGAPASPDMQQTLLDAMMDEDAAERIVLSSESFLCPPPGALGGGVLYPHAGERAAWFPPLFPEAQTEFHIAVRNLATFLPALLARPKMPPAEEALDENDPMQLSWADMIARIRAASPNVPITVWCDEDTPLIWPEVLNAVSGHDGEVPLDALYDRVASLLSEDGLARMQSYLESHPPQTEDQRRRIVSAFLDKFVPAEMLEMELDLPGWSEDYVTALTESYEDDLARIAEMRGVRLITQ